MLLPAEATGKGDESFEAKKEVTGDKKISDEDMAASKAWAAHKSDSGQVRHLPSLNSSNTWMSSEPVRQLRSETCPVGSA